MTLRFLSGSGCSVYIASVLEGRELRSGVHIGMMKVRFGGGLSSRGFREQRRGVLLKVLLRNIEWLNFLECDGR